MPFRSPWLVVIWAVMKTDYYFGESLWHLVPATVPAKIVMLLEFVTAFTTVVFLISDFVSMKDSMKRERT